MLCINATLYEQVHAVTVHTKQIKMARRPVIYLSATQVGIQKKIHKDNDLSY